MKSLSIALLFSLSLLFQPKFLTAEMGSDGLHKQSWFHQSFLELNEDLQQANEEDKFLIVLVEQAGCPYCRELHEVNFNREEITNYIQKNAIVIQLDLWGSREVIGFDDEAFEEKKWIQDQGINFTPTTIIYDMTSDGTPLEAFRLPGYFKPFHYLSSLEYVVTGEYLKQPFQRYLQDKFSELAAQGIDPDVW